MSEPLQTQRLLLRPLLLEDSVDLFAVYRDARAMRFMTTPPHASPAETRAELAQSMGYPGACAWAISLKGDSRAIGMLNFLGETPIPGMGYILHPDYWGRGIVPEACRAVLPYGFERLGYERVELWINAENAASLRVAQKLGFKLRGQIPQRYNHETVQHSMLVYGLMADAGEDRAAQFFNLEPVLIVPDMQQTTAFYRDVLGFRLVFSYGSPPTHAGVSLSGWSGSGVNIQLSQAQEGQNTSPSGSLFILVGSGLDALFEGYRQKGVTVLNAPVSRPWGMRDFTISDCNGQVLRFSTHA